MAPPPPLTICGDLDDVVPADRNHPAAAPSGLDDSLLRGRRDPNGPNLAEAPRADNHPAARPGEEQLAPSPCAIAADPDEDFAWEEETEDLEMDDFEMEPTGTDVTSSKSFRLPGEVFQKLFFHQREGLSWLWNLHCMGTGGILADDMGLGKTFQVSAFLAGLFHSRLTKRVLIVAPKTVLARWTEELTLVGLKQKIGDYYGPNKEIRNEELRRTLKEEGGVLLTTYDIVRINYKQIRGDSFNNDDGDEEGTSWNYVILDEGDRIKNPKTQRAQSLFEIPCAHRIVITGTPIQNNLKEMWAQYKFCCPDVLGDEEQFEMRYEMVILGGNDKNATAQEKHVGSKVAEKLRERIKPYFL